MAKTDYRVKSPSKFISLAKLEDLLLNNCIGNTGQEYNREEVIDLINQKQSLQDIKASTSEPVGDEQGYQDYLTRYNFQLKQDMHNKIDEIWLLKLLNNQQY